MPERTYTVSVSSPHGEHPLEQFEKAMKDVADEARSRHGIIIDLAEKPNTRRLVASMWSAIAAERKLTPSPRQ